MIRYKVFDVQRKRQAGCMLSAFDGELLKVEVPPLPLCTCSLTFKASLYAYWQWVGTVPTPVQLY